MRFGLLDQWLTGREPARTGGGAGNFEKIAGKVFLKDTRRHKKEKAPNLGAFLFFLKRDASR
ncbi:hypothetical protein [Paraburkholderia phenoliruptrix]|uniref:hypothetical protein n=1 Tax=Paraburkholderia phenoliruptrix TaxID=252970 RepID=UPI0003FF051A|nr:hypothetical protein [Paraburkholderia phenoliruptrix]